MKVEAGIPQKKDVNRELQKNQMSAAAGLLPNIEFTEQCLKVRRGQMRGVARVPLFFNPVAEHLSPCQIRRKKYRFFLAKDCVI